MALRVAWCGGLVAALVLFDAHVRAADPSNREVGEQAPDVSQTRRVWVLSEPGGYGSGARQREIVVYDLVCEQGKLTRVAEKFEAATGPKFGDGWVVRTQPGLNDAATEEQLQHTLADICGI